jgi:hypothetical protein
MTQHSVKKGLKVFGALKELQQLHDQKVMEPKGTDDITGKEQHDALRYLMFLKQKQCGKIKGCGCANEQKQ